jgi:hypothetical protein
MRFEPKTEKEIAEANLWPAGEYGFEIIEAVEKISKSGNDMIKLKLKVINNNNAFIFVDDYLLENMAYKLRHCAEACGLLESYEKGELSANDMKDKTGTLKLKISKDKTGQYADKNDVQDYVVEKKQSAHDKAKADGFKPEPNPLNDEIPW